MKNKAVALLIALICAAGGFAAATYMFKGSAQSAASIEDSVVRMIYVNDAMRNSGLSVERVLLAKKANRATLYASFSNPFSETVILKAYDRTGAEIGRSRRVLAGKTDEAAYFDFEFNANVPLKLAESFKLVYAAAVPPVESEVVEEPSVETAVPPAESVSEEAPAASEAPEQAAEAVAEKATEAATL